MLAMKNPFCSLLMVCILSGLAFVQTTGHNHSSTDTKTATLSGFETAWKNSDTKLKMEDL